MNHDLNSLEQMLDLLEETARQSEQVTLQEVLDAVGHRSFGPILLVAGMITLAPLIGDIPGIPSAVGLMVLLTAGQLLLQRRHIWIPHTLLKRSVKQRTLCKFLHWGRPVAHFLDRWSRPRLTILTRTSFFYAIAIAVSAIALAMPLMEMIPFSANGAGAALTAFGLSLIARDGVLALFALAVTVATFVVLFFSLL